MKSTRRQFVKASLSIAAVVFIDALAVRLYTIPHKKEIKDKTDASIKHPSSVDYGVQSYVADNGFISQVTGYEYNLLKTQGTTDLITI